MFSNRNLRYTEFLDFNESVQYIRQSTQLQVPDNCNGFVAVNAGDTTFWVNNFPLQPNPSFGTTGLAGESTGLIGNKGEIYKGDNMRMTITVQSPTGPNPCLIVVFKYYI